MGRWFARWPGLAGSLLLLSLFIGCGGSKTTTTEARTPASVTLSPRPNVSIELGATQLFTATTLDKNGTALSPPPEVNFVSSNPSVMTVSAGGLACAGKWDSLSNPIVCTPGGEGTAVITAVSKGVSSPTATVYVHQHIDSIVITPVPNQTTTLIDCNLGAGVTGLSKGTATTPTTFDFQVNAYSRRGGAAPGLDITGSVGPFSWQTTTAGVVSLVTGATGMATNQARVFTTNPGVTQLFATNSNVSSQPLNFTVCPVQSIALALTTGGGNTFTEASGSQAITATVTDSANVEITGVPLTWSTSNASAFTATNGSVSSVKPGSATITASCTPPSCNIGFSPSLPIYPQGVINANATGTGTAQPTTVWVASSSCKLNGVNDDNCISDVLPIDTSKNTVGTPTDVPFLPNSMTFERQGARLYLGTEQSFQGTHGLAVLTLASTAGAAPSVSVIRTAPGKVLAVSPDGRQVIISDTADTPNQVFVVLPAATPPTITPLLITGATAADFSPDGYKAYIVAGDKLYVYSAFEALKTVQLNGQASDVSFLSNGAFAYVAGGAAGPGVTVWTNCSGGLADTRPTSAVPSFIKTAPNASQVFALNSPGVDIITVNTTPAGCSPTVSNSVASFNFGQGPFNATQMIVSPNGAQIYVIADNQSSIIVFNTSSQTTSSIALNAAVPLRAGLTTDGKFLYVIGSDKTIHVVDTTTSTDTAQISLPQGLCHAKSGTAAQAYNCDPDLIAVKP